MNKALIMAALCAGLVVPGLAISCNGDGLTEKSMYSMDSMQSGALAIKPEQDHGIHTAALRKGETASILAYAPHLSATAPGAVLRKACR